nr:hypothetical protein AXX17_ATUG04880 [Tanacetum cinerariifolium]
MRSLSLVFCLLLVVFSWAGPGALQAQAALPSPRFTRPAVLLEAADVPAPPKRELRAFWIATVANIDWPTQRGESPEVYRREYRRLLDAGQRAGLNAVFVQIRPVSDAFYKSDLEPWSR